MGRIESWLRRIFPHKEIGWQDIGERFTRYTLVKTPFFSVYLHQLTAPVNHPHPHDHPWHFWAVVLAGGYWEAANGRPFVWRGPRSVLYRTARSAHTVVTPPGLTNWSVCVVSRRCRDWGFIQ